eukprot:scaffold2963_cov250-Pinguiococcus_pyrenoidosus.AAC.26
MACDRAATQENEPGDARGAPDSRPACNGGSQSFAQRTLLQARGQGNPRASPYLEERQSVEGLVELLAHRVDALHGHIGRLPKRREHLEGLRLRAAASACVETFSGGVPVGPLRCRAQEAPCATQEQSVAARARPKEPSHSPRCLLGLWPCGPRRSACWHSLRFSYFAVGWLDRDDKKLRIRGAFSFLFSCARRRCVRTNLEFHDLWECHWIREQDHECPNRSAREK